MDWLYDLAPGFRTLPDALGGIGTMVSILRQVWETGDLSPLLQIDPASAAMVVAIFGCLYIPACIALRPIFVHAKQTKADKRPTRIRRRPWYRRLNSWRRNFLKQPWYWKVGKVVASLAQTHALIVGGSGSGKSTAVVSMILQPNINLMMWLMRKLGIWKRRPVVILSFDRSDPIEEATNEVEDIGVRVRRWRMRGATGWDFLQGDREMIAEAIPTVWKESQGSTGFFSQLASDSISQALYDIDSAGKRRDWRDMVERVDAIMEEDPECPELARRTWVRRMRSLGRVMGTSIGHDFDLLSELRQGGVVHISGNSYTNPKLVPLIGTAGIMQCKSVAEQIGDAILILEEAAFLKDRKEALEDVFRSMRARGWRILYLSQDPQDVGSVLEANASVALMMGLGALAAKSRKWCEDVLRGLPGLEVKMEELVLNTTLDALEGYIVAGRKGVQAVSLAEYIVGPADRREMLLQDQAGNLGYVEERNPVPDLPRIPLDDAELAQGDSQQHKNNLKTASANQTDEVGEAEEADDYPELRELRPIIYGPVQKPNWMDGHRLREDQRDEVALQRIYEQIIYPHGLDGCYETLYSYRKDGTLKEGSNARPRTYYMGRSWLVYILLLAVKEGLDLNEVSMLTEAKVLSYEHRCHNGRCVRVEDHGEWKAPGDNSKLWHAHRRKAISRWQSEIEADVDQLEG